MHAERKAFEVHGENLKSINEINEAVRVQLRENSYNSNRDLDILRTSAANGVDTEHV